MTKSPMTALNKQALREAAEKATAGQWVVELGDEVYAVDGDDSEQIAMVFSDNGRSDAAFIAAANPATVLALLDELEAAEHTAAVDHEAACSLVEENEELKRRLESAEKRIAEQREYYEGVIAGGSKRLEEINLRNTELTMKIEPMDRRITELERSETQLIGERDDAESALNDAYKAVMGQVPEWSNWFSFADAIDEIELACGLWRNQTEDVIQFRQRIAELEGVNEYIRKRFKEIDLIFGKNLLVMQAAIIDWRATSDAKNGMAWIFNTLLGPGELPSEDEKDAQAYFDREYAPIDAELMTLYEWFRDLRNKSKSEVAERDATELVSRQLTAAAHDVLAERQRQQSVEGWTPEHDDEHGDGQLAIAASCYSLMGARESCLSDGEYQQSQKALPYLWPWAPEWWKPTSPRRDLVKAGALIIAEIERIDRAAGIGKGE